jgi:hypothetical protein
MPNLTKQMEKEVLDLLYDRKFCKEQGINYCEINGQDVEKVREWVYTQYENNTRE